MNTVQPAYNLIRDAAVATALLSPVRLKILEHLREPDSASGLARKLQMNRQQLNYHLKELEKNQLLELVEEKRKGNCIERIVRATARSYYICLQTSPEETAAQIRDKFSSAYLVAAAANIVQEVATLQELAAGEKKQLSTFSLQTEVSFADPAALHAFTEELSQTVARLATKYQAGTGEKARRYRFSLLAHPALTHKKTS
ncbi:ArsR/SmtB family transcription factor [Chitinophaga japonensis]|uniref:Helix-turn-helix protein n=1 Tax=Chitinophaga japonensis TaxID=104662 RepID=A0A562SYT3_CHIJA|nr:helix-turn-helix domain-containing protein [Chitinophaga japonensis]TWI86485.1 helix-turn-helix protein [Chitinophaga japonensis]